MIHTERHARLHVYDDVLDDARAYRARALALPFGSIPVGDDVFHGIALGDAGLVEIVSGLLPMVEAPISFFRQSPVGQREPNYIHTDCMMGDWTGIFYLNPIAPVEDGTSFWRHIDTGEIAGPPRDDMTDLSRWTRWHHVDGRFNRLLLFKADGYHSRGILDNYGVGDDARLIQVIFGRGAWM